MNFYVQVLERGAFDAWLEGQSAPALRPTDAVAIRGEERFFANGCSACHTIRGTPAVGSIGPDLTHVGSRFSIGAGTLVTGPDNLRRWLADTDRIKPGVHMPRFGMLAADDLTALAAYLEQLR
jgi:cytochrome c oxidase subunit 2